MPTPYKGLTIPLSSDLADGPAAFRDYTDSWASSEQFTSLNAGSLGVYRIFPDAAAREAWAAPNGSMAMVVNDTEPYLRVAGVWRAVGMGRTWEFAITQSFAGSGFGPINVAPTGTLRPDARHWRADVFLIVEPTAPPPLPLVFTFSFNAGGGPVEQTINVYAHATFEGLYSTFVYTGVWTDVVLSMNNTMRIASGGRLLVTDGGMA